MILLIANHANGQTHLSGKTLDAATRNVLPYVHLFDIDGKFVGISDQFGLFNISSTKMCLIAKRMGYQTDTIKIESNSNNLWLNISLHIAANELPEVDVNINYALELLRKAKARLNNQRENTVYCKSFVRSHTFSENHITEINEAVFNVQMNSSGVFGGAFDQGRYMLKKGIINRINRLDDELAFFFRIYNPWWNDPQSLFSDSVSHHYSISVQSIDSLCSNLRRIHFKAYDDLLNGFILIDVNTYSPVKYVQEKKINQKNFSASWHGKSYLEIDFKNFRDSLSLINRVAQTINLSIAGKFIPVKLTNRTQTDAYFFNVGMDKPLRYEKEKIKSSKEIKTEILQAKMDRSKYDASYWESLIESKNWPLINWKEYFNNRAVKTNIPPNQTTN